MVLPLVLYVHVVETREIQLLSESVRNWNSHLVSLHDSVVPFEEVVCAFVASIAKEKTVVLPRVLYVRVVETREIQLLSESARNWNCKIRLQSVKLCEHRICGTTYVRYFIHSEEMHR